MNKIKYLLILMILVSVGIAFGQSINLGFRDVTSGTPLTQAALNPECQALFGQNYTSTYPLSANRWRFQWYRDGGDGIISPLNTDGTPGGDDAICVGAVSPGNSIGVVTLGPTQFWTPSAVAISINVGAPGNTYVGDKVYVRVFNAPTAATATKYMSFTAVYTVPGINTTVAPIVPTWGWSAWTLINPVSYVAPNPPTVGLPSGVGLAYAGQTLSWTAPTTDATHRAATSYDVFFGPTLPGTPVNQAALTFPTGVLQPGTTYQCRVVAKNAEGSSEPLNWSFTTRSIVDPLAAINPSPVDGFNFAVGLYPYDQALSWSDNPAGQTPTGFKLYWGADPVVDLGNVHSAIVSIPEPGTYTWQIVPYYNDLGTRKNVADQTRSINGGTSETRGDAANCPVWSFTVVAPEAPAVLTYPPDMSHGAPYATLNLTWNITGADPNSFFELFLGTTNPPTVVVYTGTAMNFVPTTLQPLTTYYWFVRYHYGLSRATADSPIWQFITSDQPTPVSLTTFTAVYTADLFVQLTWVVASETNHMGYYVLRSDNNEVVNAQTLNSTDPIDTGANAGTQITYNYRDDQLSADQTYYYWLQSVDLGGQSQFFGPISVIVAPGTDPENPPIIPGMTTSLLNAYPNPFNASISSAIPYYLKDAASVKIEIYNVKGNVVLSYTASNNAAGYHTLNWNGKDMNGKSVSSGIYYYRMTSGKFTASKKIVLVK